MTSPPPPAPQLSSFPSIGTPSGSSSNRPQQSAWGLPQQQQLGRRGLTPLSTSTTSNTQRPTNTLQSPRNPDRNPWSPVASTFAPLTSTSGRQGVRSPPATSANPPFSPPALGQPLGQSSTLLSSTRSRTIPPQTNAQSASAAAISQGSNLSGNSSGGNAKSFRASPSLTQSNFPIPSTTSTTLPSLGTGQSGQLSKIVVAQLFLLLSTLKDDKDKTKWDLQVDQIKKLVDSNGMEVFTKYFRRLLSSNPQIWGSGRTSDGTGSYTILIGEMQKITQGPAQAAKIVESIEGGEGDIFKDFDLATFMDHFKLSPMAKVTLASAFLRSSKSDLRSKAETILSNNLRGFFLAIAEPSVTTSSDPVEEISTAMYANITDRLAQDPPRTWNSESQQILTQAFQQRFNHAGSLIPLEISATLQLFELLTSSNTLVRLIKKHGHKATETREACKNILESADLRDISYQQVANAILFMVIARDDPPYDPSVFVSALSEHRGGQRLDWQDVVHAFDREGLKITRQHFKKIYDALLPLAVANESFDVQLLWGGDWHHEETQLTFAAAFVSFTEDELDASTIPRLRKAFVLEDFDDASEEVKTYAKSAVRHPLVSVDASKALFNMVFRSSDTYTHAQNFGVVDTIINPKSDLFVCSVSAVPKPWSALQDQAIKQLVASFFWKAGAGRSFALHLLWKRDMNWLIQRLQQYYQQRPLQLFQILELAQDHGWLNDLISVSNEFSLDLALLAHGKDLFDLEPWLHQICQAMSKSRFVPALSNHLRTKAEDDLKEQRGESEHLLVPLTIKTVYVLLNFLANEGLSEEERTQMQRICIQAYPRLINYGEGFDTVIEANSQDSNRLSSDADGKMQEHYKLMYSGEKQVRDIVEDLQKYKTSEDSIEQELFACMIFGLFDEYNCFGEYPLDALATTAVLFGSIINFNLLSRIALQVAISMVLEAVRDYNPSDSMYKFGLQALLHFQDRLEEWLSLSKVLVQLPSLQGTPIYPHLEKVLREAQNAPDGERDGHEAVNGAVDDFLAPEPKIPDFSCLTVDPPSRLDFYEAPDEEVQETVLFILNNVSERNLAAKTSELTTKLQEEHYQWFANYMVESRIKPQPNYHQLYMSLLDLFEDKVLWAEVLRETYCSTIRMLNSEASLNSSNERSQLKNLAGWLGSMTLARNQAVKHKNISFKDLLIEAHQTQRLIVAIPFTCKVLSMAANSLVFQPPCSWIMEILGILIELYHFADLKLNLKFEIEVLCKTLEVDHKELEPSGVIRAAPTEEVEALGPVLSDGIEGFNDLSLMPFNRPRAIAERFSPSNMAPELSELSSILKHNYSLPPSTGPVQARIRHLLALAAERAVSEIIGPVVERSVTIAAISTAQIIAKDFALEPDAERYRECAHVLVKRLSGSLAGVTCKEPLRGSMQNNISLLRHEVPEQALPQGLVLMFVNDNLEAVCNIVQKAAETASMNEIDAQIEEAMQARKAPGGYIEPPISPWAGYIPDPFRPTPGGLNTQQLAIYTEFGRATRGPAAHGESTSLDNGRQVPDILQDQYSATPSLPGPSEAPPISGQSQHQLNQLSQTPVSQHMLNGFVNMQTLRGRVHELVQALYQAVKDATEQGIDQPFSDIPQIQELWLRLRDTVTAAGLAYKDEAAYATAGEIVGLLESEVQALPVTEFISEILYKLCSISDRTAREVHGWSTRLLRERPARMHLLIAAIKSRLLEVRRVDLTLARELQNRDISAIKLLQDLVNGILNADVPSALRADLANSIVELTRWSAEAPNQTEVQATMRQLQDSGLAIDEVDASDAQLQYVFEEWIRLQSNSPTGPAHLTFVHQMYAKGVLGSREETILFLRSCADASILAFEQEELKQNGSIDEAYIKVDALSKLIVLLASHQAKLDRASHAATQSFFDGALTILVLVFAHQYNTKGDRFNSKVFFRLFSSILHEIHAPQIIMHGNSGEMLQSFGMCLLKLRPQLFPGFAFHWLSLHAHRLFMPALLRLQDENGWSIYCELLERQTEYVGNLLKAVDISLMTKDYYRGFLKLLLVLHHDFPDFLAENHFRILRYIPAHCTQMRSLVVSACPSTIHDLPDPFTEGLKVDRVEDMKRSPIIRGDIEAVLVDAGILAATDSILSGDDNNEHYETILSAVRSDIDGSDNTYVDSQLLNAIVIHIVQHAETANSARGAIFATSSPHAQFMDNLVDKLGPEGRYQFISAIANQLRYPSTHTHFFMYALLHLFRAGQTGQLVLDIQQEITRVFVERIVVHRPHPWGLMVTIIELLKNHTYRFWELPFVKGFPDLERMLGPLLQQIPPTARNLV